MLGTHGQILKSLDPFHPAFGAIQCPRSWEFLDGPGSRGDGPGFDVPMHENYDPSFPGHAGQGPRAPIEQALGDMPLRSYPVEHEPIVNCPWGESTQYYLFAPRVEGGAGPMGGVPVAPMSPDGLRGIGWLGTVYDLHDVLWYTYNKLGSGSPGPKDRLAAAASQLAFEMKEVYPSLTGVKDGTVPRAVATAVTSSAELQPWVKARAWAEPPAPGTTGAVSTGDWNPVTGIDPGMCKPNGQTQTVGTPCATSAVCVHVLVANTAPHAATTAVQVKIVDRFGRDTGQLAGSLHATLPFAGFESGEMLPVRDGLFSDTLPAFSVRMFRLGCGAPPIDVGNLVPNPSFEDGTITGAVASWGLFAQHEQRDQRVMLTSDTAHKKSGRHSARLVLPTERPGGAVTYQGQLAVPFSLGGGQSSPDCGNGYQGFYLPAGFRYNISIWARSDDVGMNVSIASGRWVASVASRIWEYTGQPQVSLAPLTQSWTQLSWQHSANTTECLQLLVAGRGQINLDDAFISRAPLPSKTDDDALPAEIVVEHGSALVGRGYKSSQSTSVGLPVQMAKGETESAQVVIVTASTALHGVTVSAQAVPGLDITVAPIGFARVGPCPFAVEPAAYNKTCPADKPWYCPNAGTGQGGWSGIGCVKDAGMCRGCSGMGPQVCCNYHTEQGVANGEIGPVSAGAASWCPNAQGGPATYATPNDTMYAPEARFQPHVVLTHVLRFDVAPRSAQPVLIKIKSTRQTAAGNHSVSVTVADAAGHSQTVAVHVTVWDFALPEGWHFPSLWGVWSGGPKDVWSNISSSHTNVSQFEMDLVDLLL